MNKEYQSQGEFSVVEVHSQQSHLMQLRAPHRFETVTLPQIPPTADSFDLCYWLIFESAGFDISTPTR